MIQALLPVFLGGLLALAGAAIGPFFQRRHERWRAKREDRATMRDKAQLLFEEIDSLVRESQLASVDAIGRLKGDKTDIPRPIPDLGRVRALVAIYFPSASQMVADFEAKSRSHISRTNDMVKKIMDESGSVDKLSGIPALLATTHQGYVSEFASELRSHLVENMRKFLVEED